MHKFHLKINQFLFNSISMLLTMNKCINHSKNVINEDILYFTTYALNTILLPKCMLVYMYVNHFAFFS